MNRENYKKWEPARIWEPTPLRQSPVQVGIRVCGLLIAVVVLCFGCADQSRTLRFPSDKRQAETSLLTELPSFQSGHYRVDPYINAAIHLQSIGRDAAFGELYALADTDDLEAAQKLVVLCNMLYSPPKGVAFKPAAIGAPGFYGEDDYACITGKAHGYEVWKTVPIEIVSGIPFAVINGYFYQGPWDSSLIKAYVRYCETKCDWNTTKYTTKTMDEKRAALDQLSNSTKWSVSHVKVRLFLDRQIH